ncbi:MAG: hypothetical protein AAF958_13335 [Planctomycetota bacterium]
MTPADSLYVNNWGAIVDSQHELAVAENSKFLVPPTVFTGEPVQILAIFLPFLCVRRARSGLNDTIDLRRFNVQKLETAYVKAMLANHTEASYLEASERLAEKSVAEPQSKRICPVCGESMSEVAIIGVRKEWHLNCQNCGFSGKLP